MRTTYDEVSREANHDYLEFCDFQGQDHDDEIGEALKEMHMGPAHRAVPVGAYEVFSWDPFQWILYERPELVPPRRLVELYRMFRRMAGGAA